MKYLIILLVILIIFVIWRKLNFKKKREEILGIDEPKVSFLEMIKSEKKEEIISVENLLFDINLSSVVKKNETLEFLISIINKSEKMVRIDVKEAIFYSEINKKSIKADVTFYGELAMGTNDILLKNTILPDSEVIRNIYFFNTQFIDFHQNDYLEISLDIDNQSYDFKKYFHQSNFQTIKYIQST